MGVLMALSVTGVYVGVLMALSVTGVCGSVDDCLLQVYVKVCVEVWMAVC